MIKYSKVFVRFNRNMSSLRENSLSTEELEI